MKKITIILGVLVVLVGGYFLVVKDRVSSVGYKDATYTINGQKITLVNGSAETEAAPGSVSKLVTKYFGNEVVHYINNDGRDDVVFLLTQSGGGSGTFYYVVGALNTPDGYVGTAGLLLGDRIAPQTTEIGKNLGAGNLIVVNYAGRNPGESFAVAPSVAKSIWLLLDTKTMQFGEVVQNFEGESNLESQITYKNASKDDIVVQLPYPGAVTGKEFDVIGQARGWYFEASFPVKVLDKNGKVLFSGPAQAQGDWMTANFVPFKIHVKVPDSYIGKATLVLSKDNPSDMRSKDASMSFEFTIEY